MFSAFCCWHLLASAADWEVVADTRLGQIQFDKASIVKEYQLHKAVIAYDFKEKQRIAQPPYALFNRREDSVLVDCKHPALGVESRQFYDGDRLVGAFDIKSSNVKFNLPEPDTMANTVFEAICGVVEK